MAMQTTAHVHQPLRWVGRVPTGQKHFEPTTPSPQGQPPKWFITGILLQVYRTRHWDGFPRLGLVVEDEHFELSCMYVCVQRYVIHVFVTQVHQTYVFQVPDKMSTPHVLPIKSTQLKSCQSDIRDSIGETGVVVEMAEQVNKVLKSGSKCANYTQKATASRAEASTHIHVVKVLVVRKHSLQGRSCAIKGLLSYQAGINLALIMIYIRLATQHNHRVGSLYKQGWPGRYIDI